MEEIRRLHNNIKRTLIQDVTPKNAQRVLDVGCGRGGDLQKWTKVINRVDMCDPDDESLSEAKRRCKNMNLKGFRFYSGDIARCPNITYDAICYNFSLHYIFENERLFFQSINQIKKRLKPGGKLFGCIPDSEKIITMKNSTFYDNFGNYFMLNDTSSGFGRFGEKINVYLTDTPFYGDGKPKPEPIAYKDLLITHLENMGIYLELWEPLDTGMEISGMYSKFIFVNK